MRKMHYIKQNTPAALKIEQKLKENGGYCPCSIIQSEDTKCMCKEFREKTTIGLCHCGLYFKDLVEED